MADLLLPVAACPGILTDWCGPVALRDYALGNVQTVHRGLHGRRQVYDEFSDRWRSVADVEDRLSLDLARPECADRAARWLAGRRGLDTSAGVIWLYDVTDLWWILGGADRSVGCEPTPSPDPTDDTRLPDGSRVVDRLALKLCCMAAGNAAKESR